MKERRILGLDRNVFLLGLTSLFNDLSSEMVLSALPAFFISVLKAGAQSMGVVEGIADAAASFLKIVSGRLSDRIQRRKLFAFIGYSISVATRPFYVLAGSVAGVAGLRITDRVGKGFRDSPRDALISLSVPEAELGKSFGYHRAMDTTGAILGPLAAYLILRRTPGAFGTVFMTAFVAGILAIASIGLVRDVAGAFASKKKMSLSMWAELPQRFKTFLGAVAVLSLGTLPVAVLLFRTSDLGFVVASIPLFYMVYNVSYAALSIPAGKLADAWSFARVVFIGYLFLIAGYLVLGVAESRPVLVLGFLLIGAFSALTDGVQRSLASTLVPPELKGSAFGYLNAALGLGALGAGLLGGLVWQRFGDTAALAAGSAVVAIGLALFAAVMPKSSASPAE